MESGWKLSAELKGARHESLNKLQLLEYLNDTVVIDFAMMKRNGIS